MVNDPKDIKEEFWRSLLDKATKMDLKLITNKSGITAFENNTVRYIFQYDKTQNQWCGMVGGSKDNEWSTTFVTLDESEWFCMVLTFLNDWCRRQ